MTFVTMSLFSWRRPDRINILDAPKRREAPIVQCQINLDRDQFWHPKNLVFVAAVAPGWDESAMATAAHYRKLAEECFQWAHEARDVSVRRHYAKLCEIWLECAARAELRSGATTLPEPTTEKAA